jgi:hypothetical protein
MRAGRASVLVAGVLAAAMITVVACETVELGAPPADVNACRPSQQFFVDQIWPNFLAMEYGGAHCYDSTCHGGASNNSLRLTVPTSTATIPLAAEWYDNYVSTTQQMKCTNVAASLLLEKPSGLQPHLGGALISPNGDEATLIKMWITQP